MKDSKEAYMCIPAVISLVCAIYNYFIENNYNDIITAIWFCCIALICIQLIKHSKIYIILTIIFLMLGISFLLKYLMDW